mgnify:CR=1 FL=1
MLDKIDRLEKPIDIDDSMDIRLEPDVESGKGCAYRYRPEQVF